MISKQNMIDFILEEMENDLKDLEYYDLFRIFNEESVVDSLIRMKECAHERRRFS